MNKAIKFLLQTIITIMLSIEYGYADETQDCQNGFEYNGECQNCPENATCSNNIFTCDANYYKSENTCIACPANTSCTQNVFTCDDKYYKHNNSCIQCPSNTTSNSDNSSCNCGQDKFFNTQTGTCMNCPSYSTCDGSNITGCKDGYFKYNDTCYPCNQNTMYCPNTDAQFTCKSGYYKGTNTTCDKCPTGMTSADRNTSNSATACYFNSSTTYNGNTFNSTKRDYGSKYNITFTQDQQSSQKN